MLQSTKHTYFYLYTPIVAESDKTLFNVAEERNSRKTNGQKTKSKHDLAVLTLL